MRSRINSDLSPEWRKVWDKHVLTLQGKAKEGGGGREHRVRCGLQKRLNANVIMTQGKINCLGTSKRNKMLFSGRCK